MLLEEEGRGSEPARHASSSCIVGYPVPAHEFVLCLREHGVQPPRTNRTPAVHPRVPLLLVITPRDLLISGGFLKKCLCFAG